jgi:hypothetical protein
MAVDGSKKNYDKKLLNMSDEVSKKCLKTLKQYNKCKSEDKKIILRNELFMYLKNFLFLWINRTLNKWCRYETRNEILSLSWSAFEFCLKYYKPKFDNIPNFFHSYTRYFLFNHYAKKDEGIRIPFDELKTILYQFPTPQNQQFDRLLTLYQYRDVIPERYRKVWDDATLSLDPSKKRRVFDPDGSGLDVNTYRHMKNSFVPIIKLILGIKEQNKEKG